MCEVMGEKKTHTHAHTLPTLSHLSETHNDILSGTHDLLRRVRMKNIIRIHEILSIRNRISQKIKRVEYVESNGIN